MNPLQTYALCAALRAMNRPVGPSAASCDETARDHDRWLSIQSAKTKSYDAEIDAYTPPPPPPEQTTLKSRTSYIQDINLRHSEAIARLKPR